MIPIERLWAAFDRHPKLRDQAQAYREVFSSPAAREFVLPDFVDFCGVLCPLPADVAAMQRQAGRLDFFHHINHYLDLSINDITTLLHGSNDTLRRFG